MFLLEIKGGKYLYIFPTSKDERFRIRDRTQDIRKKLDRGMLFRNYSFDSASWLGSDKREAIFESLSK